MGGDLHVLPLLHQGHKGGHDGGGEHHALCQAGAEAARQAGVAMLVQVKGWCWLQDREVAPMK